MHLLIQAWRVCAQEFQEENVTTRLADNKHQLSFTSNKDYCQLANTHNIEPLIKVLVEMNIYPESKDLFHIKELNLLVHGLH